ncbi:MAG: response regulator transcription factor [Actinomycetota bacterium]|jgi:DNA-binding NarL/FixJ family response regulator|nr:response regulator transcription factor [Actinomycetota bacterium]
MMEPTDLEMTREVAVRVVIVDDQEPFRQAARMVVELSDGFDVAGEAASGEEAVELVRALDPDLVLMDVNLPGIDGLEATRRILAEAPRSRVVLVLSTYEADDYEAQALAAGASAFIPKSSFGPDTLEAAWNAAISA